MNKHEYFLMPTNMNVLFIAMIDNSS